MKNDSYTDKMTNNKIKSVYVAASLMVGKAGRLMGLV